MEPIQLLRTLAWILSGYHKDTLKEADRHTERQKVSWIERQIVDEQKDRVSDVQNDRVSDGQKDRVSDRQRDRSQVDKKTEC